MPLQKILFKPGINRENTRYTTEGGWYDGNKIRFRQGTPEVIGGWQQTSNTQFLGVCRSLWAWNTLSGNTYIGIGTNTKFYLDDATGAYYDITPLRKTVTLANPFTAAYSTLSAGITASDTSLTVASGTNFASKGVVLIGTEKIAYTSKSTNTLSGLTRGYDGTTAASHSLGAGVGSYTVTVHDVGHGGNTGDYVTFSGATSLGGNITATVLNKEYVITFVDADNYTITASVAANSSDTGDGGSSVVTKYQISVGPEIAVPLVGWGAGPWGSGTWGHGGASAANVPMRIWSQSNWGEDLVFAHNQDTIYFWAPSYTTASPGVAINTLGGSFTVDTATPAVITFSDVVLSEGTRITVDGGTSSLPDGTYYVRNPIGNTCNLSTSEAGALLGPYSSGTGTITDLLDVPVATSFIFVSDTYRFLMAFGSNPITDTVQDRMIIRWADQESLTDWYPSTANQAGELRLSHGSQIVTAVQTRQEIFTLTDSSAYSLQYVGPPYVWTSQLMADNISVASQNAVAIASGVVYWMGLDKFYRYDGRVQTLRCDLREYIYSDFNQAQAIQTYSGTVEGFNEIWWFYCSANATSPDRYVVYNYAEDIWYYGTMDRTAWLDSGVFSFPIATDANRRLIQHETGLNDAALQTPAPIDAYITSSEFDIGDGHNFGFVWRILPDITFRGSTAGAPSVTMTLYPLDSSGSGYLVPASEGGTNFASVTKQYSTNVEAFTGQIFVRVRGRQMAFKVESNQLNTTWQLGAPRIDIKPDGRRGGKVT